MQEPGVKLTMALSVKLVTNVAHWADDSGSTVAEASQTNL
jgi:hypothetical protein